MTGPAQLRTADLTLGYGDQTILTGLDLDVRPGEIVVVLGPSGGGKTWTGLSIAGGLAEGERFAVIDTERNAATLYVNDLPVEFDHFPMRRYNPRGLIKALAAAAQARYPVVMIDSLTHFWKGSEGTLDQVSQVADSKYSGVKKAEPMQFYLPRRQNARLGGMTFYVRAHGDPEAMLAQVPQVVAGVEEPVPVRLVLFVLADSTPFWLGSQWDGYIECSFRVKEAGYRAVVVDVPVARHEHRVWSNTPPSERDRLSKRNYYRFLDRFRALPGDYANATATITNISAAACNAGNGNGNGNVGSFNGNGNGTYTFKKSTGKTVSGVQLVDFYAKLVSKYPIVSIEDGCAEGDWATWKKLTDAIGDRVDVMLTRKQTNQNDERHYTDILLQNVRVLAVDQEANETRNKPVVAKAVTVEVTPYQAQQLTLAGQVGHLSLALRKETTSAAGHFRTVGLGDLRPGSGDEAVRKVAPSMIPLSRPTTTRINVIRGVPNKVEVVPIEHVQPPAKRLESDASTAN